MTPALRAMLDNAVNTAADYAVCMALKGKDLEAKKLACVETKQKLEHALEALENAAKNGPVDYDFTTGSMLVSQGK